MPTTFLRQVRVGLAACVLLVLVSFSTVMGDTVDVSIPGFSFDPADIVITPGTTVRWTNNHSIAHTTTSDDGGTTWDSGNMPAGAEFSFTFNTPGVYPYLCTFHPSMTGSVTVLQELYTIPELYEDLSIVEGQSVAVFGEYSSPEDPKIVTSYSKYLERRLMDSNSIAFLDNLTPDADSWYGGGLIVYGTVVSSPNNNPTHADDSVFIHIEADSAQAIYIGYHPPEPILKGDNQLLEPFACDPCKFAILISGGGDSLDNHPGFWEDIENLYTHKVNNEDYCPENIEVVYFEGNSEDTAVIPDSMVHSATDANVQAAHERIAQKIAECTRNGDSATVQKMVSNHGEDGDGIVLLGNNHISGAELRGYQQMLIDSCCKYMYDEMTQCFGGQIIDSLKNLDDQEKTEIHANSAAGSGALAWGDNDGSPYLLKKIERLAAGDEYETAVDSARNHYKDWLEAFKQDIMDHIDRLEEIRDSVGAGHPWIPIIDSLLREDSLTCMDLDTSIYYGSPSWSRYQFQEYCEWEKFYIPPDGQAEFEFEGEGGCGNVTVYCEFFGFILEKARQWNWNLPGSFGFQSGNDTRVVKSSDPFVTAYWLHNDNGQFTVTITSNPIQDTTAEDISNIAEFANASNGGNDGSSAEFGDINDPQLLVVGWEQDGFQLSNLPRQLGPCGGVQELQVPFITQMNQWWTDMELYINVNQVIQPGQLIVNCPQAANPMQTINITGPGEYTAHLGFIPAPGEIFLTMDASSPSGAPCFTFDSWALRSLVPTYEDQFLCGDANEDGGVNVSDAVWIINFVFANGDPPMPLEAGDANCDGQVNVSDAVWIINFVFANGAAPCECK